MNWAAHQAESILEGKPNCDETAAAIDAALSARSQRKALPVVGNLGEGWIERKLLRLGSIAQFTANRLPATPVIAANHDGDSDSTASIAGQLYGAAQGLSDLPNRWVRRLDVLIPLLRLAGEWIGIESN